MGSENLGPVYTSRWGGGLSAARDAGGCSARSNDSRVAAACETGVGVNFVEFNLRKKGSINSLLICRAEYKIQFFFQVWCLRSNNKTNKRATPDQFIILAIYTCRDFASSMI